MKKMLIAGVMLTVLFITGLLSCEEARAVEESAVILFMEGDVKVKKMGIIEWKGALEGMVLSTGDQLKTGISSWAEIGFGEEHRNVVRVQEDTLMELAFLGSAEINLLKGELRALVEKLRKDEKFEIITPTAICGARGTGWDTNTDGIKVVVDVYEDEIYFNALGGVAPIIKAGKRGILEDPRKPITIKNVPIAKIRSWTRWKRDFRQRKRTEKGIKRRIKTIDQGQKAIETMTKGKKGIRDKKEQKKIDTDRVKDSSSSY